MSLSPQRRDVAGLLYVLGPFLMLLFVVALFGLLLAIQDLRAQMDTLDAHGWTGFWNTFRRSPFTRSVYQGCGAFLSGPNFKIVLTQTVIVAVSALGMTLIIVSGGIDLSVGSVVAFTSVVGATLLTRNHSPALAGAAALLAGVVVGCINGAVIAGFRMMPFIVTLGMMGIARGSAKWLAGNQTVNPAENPINNIMALAEPEHLFPLPLGVWIAIALAVVMSILMRQTVFGRYVFAIGSNEATARLCGIRVQLHKLLIYSLAGLFFGLSGLLQLSRLTQGDPTVAAGLELDIIAAVVIGGASLNGGTGSILGSMIGALIMAFLRNGSNIMGWPNYMQEIIIGGVIILAVGLDKFRQTRASAAM
jgi:ribose transport system permease protein